MRILKVMALQGPNYWSRRPALEAWVDLEQLEESPSNTLPGFNERLVAWLPSLVEHRCSIGTRGGFLKRLRDGTWMGHVLEHVSLELQTLAGMPVGFGRARETAHRGVYRVAVRYLEEPVGRASLDIAFDLLHAAISGAPFDVAAKLAELRAIAERVQLEPNTAAIVTAAQARGIPIQRLSDHQLVQLGQGEKQHRVWTAQTERTSAIAEWISKNKDVTQQLLRSAGVPVHEGQGVEHRLLVVNGRLVAAARRVAAVGVGDQAPAPRWIDVTDQVHPSVAVQVVLAARAVGLDIAGVNILAEEISRPLEPQRGAVVEVSAGPSLQPHVDIEREVQAGFELRPAGPELSSEQRSIGGRRSGVAEAIVSSLFAEGDDGRVPVVGITGTNGKTIVAHLLRQLWRSMGIRVGLCSSEGLFFAERQLRHGHCASALPARDLFVHPRLQAAVCESDQQSILCEGLGYDQCKVAIVTNIGTGDHLGQHFIDDLDQLFTVKRCPVDIVPPHGAAVLKADDPLVANMAKLCAGEVVFFGLDRDHPVLAHHRMAGKRTATIRDGELVLGRGDDEVPLVPVAEVLLAANGRIPFQLENALATAAAADILGMPLDRIRGVLRSFEMNAELPGRFTLLHGSSPIVVDRCPNRAALGAVIDALDRLSNGSRSVVFAPSPNRHEDEIVGQGRLLAQGFDRVILHPGTGGAEALAMLRRGLSDGGRVYEVIDTDSSRSALERLHATASARSSRDEVALIQVEAQEAPRLIERVCSIFAAERMPWTSLSTTGSLKRGLARDG